MTLKRVFDIMESEFKQIFESILCEQIRNNFEEKEIEFNQKDMEQILQHQTIYNNLCVILVHINNIQDSLNVN